MVKERIIMVRKKFIKELNGEILNIWDNILDFIQYNKISIFFYHVIRFLKRLPKWLKLCWNTESWDYSYMYDYLEMFLQDLLKAQEEDTWHVEKETKMRAKQIKICLEHLYRYKDSFKYYPYPDSKMVPTEEYPDGCTGYIVKYNNKKDEITAKNYHKYEEFHHDMFWKNMLKWYRGWWT